MITAYATNANSFNKSDPIGGFIQYDMYVTLALRIVAEAMAGEKVQVESRWVGIADVYLEDGQEITWLQESSAPDAMPYDYYEPVVLPADLNEVVLMREGLPPTPFSAFTNTDHTLLPLWWNDWVEQAMTANETTTTQKATPNNSSIAPPAATHKRVAWDLGAGVAPRAKQTSVEVANAKGEKSKVYFRWHIPRNMCDDVIFKARVESETEQIDDARARKLAIDFVQEMVPIDQWLYRLARRCWIQTVEPIQLEKYSGRHKEERGIGMLNLSLRVYFSRPFSERNCLDFFAWSLSAALSAKKMLPPGGRLKLLTHNYGVALNAELFGQAFSDRLREIRLWPPRPAQTIPLRPAQEPDASIMARLEKIKTRLAELRERDSNYEVFGAHSHKYQLKPCLDEKTVQEFENQWSIILPEEYRLFLLHAGDGGAGPGYGVWSLKESRSYSHGLLDQPFPHSTVYELYPDENNAPEDAPSGQPATMPVFREYTKFDEFSDEEHDDPEADGALFIISLGCSQVILLILTGEQCGTLWFDDRGSSGILAPMAQKEPAESLSFLDYYEYWLNECFESVTKKR